MLASDMNNPEFAGAVSNPDAALIVNFYVRPVQNIFQSSKIGRPIYEDTTYIKINVPGLKDMEVDRPAYEADKRRFPMQWQHFENRTKGDAREIGTPLSEWQQLTRSQAEEFRALKFFTIESIANASDLNVNALGMIGGMSPYVLREKARAFLKAATDSALPQHQAEELAKRDAEITMLKEQMAAIANRLNAAPQPAPVPAGQVVTPSSPAAVAAQPMKRKRGRPSKAEIEARKIPHNPEAIA
jgi:hypothetical protein